MTHVPVYLSPKRKRGRPRKDAKLCKANSFKSLAKPHIKKDDGMVGRTVYGVIEGSFDAGFLISVKTSNKCTPFRGVVFHSDKVVPVTPANDLAPDAMMYPRRQIPAVAYTLPSQFNCISPISSCRPQTSIVPYALTGNSTFSVSEPTVPKMGSYFNVGGNVTPQGNSGFVNNKPSSACPIDNFGLIEHDESLFGFNMNNVVKFGEMVSEASFESMFDTFLGSGMKTNGSALETHHNFAPQSEFGTQKNANQCVWQGEPQVINSELELTDVYRSETSNLDINFHQNIFTYPSQDGSPESNFHQHAFSERVSTSPNLMPNLASVKQEKKSLQEPEPSNAHVETRYLVPFLQIAENETNMVLKSVLETGKRFHDEVGSSLAEVGSPGPVLKEESLFDLKLATVQSTTERCVKQKSSSIDSITDMDYVLSDVVQFEEPHGHFWETNFT